MPKFVAEWFEEHNRDLDYSIWECIYDWNSHDKNDQFRKWMNDLTNNPIETIIRMKDGYEIEKEPLYRVKIGNGYFAEYRGKGVLIMHDKSKEIKIFDSKSEAERTSSIIGGIVEEVSEG